MRLSDLLQTIQPVRITGNTSMEITGVNIDSRLIGTGHLFMAMRGTQTDGHAYIPAAIDKGAVAVLCEELPEELKAGITYIQVKDSEDAVGKVATTFYGDPTSKMELIGVTGTNGKTTVATLLYNTFRYFGYKGRTGFHCMQLHRRPARTDRTHHPGPDNPEPPARRNGRFRLQVCLHGSQFPFHCPEAHQRSEVCRRYFH